MRVDAPELRIRAWQPRDAEAFRALNLAWIEEHFEVEEVDRLQLSDPRAAILRPGGAIRVAEAGEGVVGVCALVFAEPGVYEVAKMAVRRGQRARGIGRRLLDDVVAHARALGARRLLIRSHRSLEAALRLYLSFGFVEVPLPPAREYARHDISLQLELE